MSFAYISKYPFEYLKTKDSKQFNGVLEFKFANCVTEAINHYLELFKKDFEKYLAEPSIAYVMTNNIQQIREQLQELYITMGQDQLADKAKDLFKGSQQQLSKTLGKVVTLFSSIRLSRQIT